MNIIENIDLLHTNAAEKHKQGSLVEAISFYLEAIKIQAEQPCWIYGNAITVLGQLNRIEEAIALFNTAKTRYPDSDEIYRAAGIVFQKQGDVDNCMANFYRAFEIEHQQPKWLYIHLLEYLIKHNDLKRLKKIAEAAIDLYPDDITINYYFAEILFYQQHWSLAIEYYQKVSASSADFPDLENKLNVAIASQFKGQKIQVLTDNFPDYNQESNDFNLDEPFDVFLFPDYRATNSYQSLLYSDAGSMVTVNAGSIDDALEHISQRLLRRKTTEPALTVAQPNASKTVFHLHWTTPILAKATTELEASLLKDRFIDNLLKFAYEGGCIVWTIHNILPHDCQFVAQEIELRRAICQIANKIHVHAEKSIAEIAEVFSLPSNKITIIPHGNYLTDNQNYVDRAIARKRFGYQPDDVVYLFLGQIRPYKGIDELISAFVRIQKDFPQSHLLIAGQPVNPIRKEGIANRTKVFPNLTVIEKRLSDSELQWFFNAADVVVLPYRKILTSGSVLNALSFNRPVIAPKIGMIEEVVRDGFNGYLYNPDQIETLIDSMSQVAQLTIEEREQLFIQSGESIQHLTWLQAAPKLLSNLTPYVDSVEIEIETEVVQCKLWHPLKPQTTEGSVAIVILNYGEINDTIRLVKSLEESSYSNFQIVIIDNFSPNTTLTELIDSFPQYTIIRTPDNLGYAGGNNVGIKYLQQFGFDFVWILNPDTTVEPNTLENLFQAATNHTDINVFGSAICYGHRPETIWFAGGLIQVKPTGFNTCHMYDGHEVDLLPQEVYEADYITGASLFCRTHAFTEVGLIPERYFLYFEETEWCLRAKEHNYKLAVVPTSKIYHHKRSQVGGLPTKYYFYYYIRGSILFMMQYFSQEHQLLRQSICDKFVNPWNRKIKRKAPKQAAFFAALAEQAISDGLAGITGKVDLLRVFEDSVTRFEDRDSHVLEGKLFLSAEEVHGWVRNSEQLLERLKVAIVIDGQIVEELLADNHLKDLPGGDGNYGFRYKLPKYLIDSKTHQIEVRVGDYKLDSQVSSFCFPSLEAAYKGRIDGIDKMNVKGWAVDINHPDQIMEVEILDGELVIAKTKADIKRSDLAKAGINNFYGGFSAAIPRKYCDGNKHNLSLRIVGTKKITSQRSVMMSTDSYPQIQAKSLAELWQWLYQHRQISLIHESNLHSPLLQEIAAYQNQLIGQFKTRPRQQLVSIIMPTYNRSNTVIAAINSVIAQSYDNWELLIADDGSYDNTTSIIKEFISGTNYEDRITLIELSENGGVSKARNAALAKAQGDVIAYLDSDNTWDLDYLLIMVNMLLENSWAKVAYCGDRIWQYYPHNQALPSGLETVAIRLGHFNKSLIENRNYIDLNVFVHWRELYQELGGFREDMRRLVDWELILRYTNVAPPKFVPAILANYFMGLCDNQITQVESYADNSSKLQETISSLSS